MTDTDQSKRRNRHALTPEQIAVFENNPNIATISSRCVFFTLAFKNRFAEEFHKGRTATDILIESRISPDILGRDRIKTLTNYYYQKWLPMHGESTTKRFENRKKRLNDLASLPNADTNSNTIDTTSTHQTNKKKIEKMEGQISYLEQEIDFLKKILIANREEAKAYQLAISRQDPAQNTKSSKK